LENRVGDPAEQGLSGEHREDLQMQRKHQFSARKQYFNGNGQSAGMDGQVYKQDENLQTKMKETTATNQTMTK